MSSPVLRLPPGPSFILRQLFSWEFATYATSVYLVHLGNEVLGLDVPRWATVSCSILALPCIPLAHAQYCRWRDRRKATSLGARLVPVVPMRSIGGIDLIAAWMEAFRTGYVGEYIDPCLVPSDLLKPLQAMCLLIGWPGVVRRLICVLCGRPA